MCICEHFRTNTLFTKNSHFSQKHRYCRWCKDWWVLADTGGHLVAIFIASVFWNPQTTTFCVNKSHHIKTLFLVLIRAAQQNIPVYYQLQCQQRSSQTQWARKPQETGLCWTQWADTSFHKLHLPLSPAFSWLLPLLQEKQAVNSKNIWSICKNWEIRFMASRHWTITTSKNLMRNCAASNLQQSSRRCFHLSVVTSTQRLRFRILVDLGLRFPSSMIIHTRQCFWPTRYQEGQSTCSRIMALSKITSTLTCWSTPQTPN